MGCVGGRGSGCVGGLVELVFFFFGWLLFFDFSGASTGATVGRTGSGVVGLPPQGHEGW